MQQSSLSISLVVMNSSVILAISVAVIMTKLFTIMVCFCSLLFPSLSSDILLVYDRVSQEDSYCAVP